MPMRHTATQPAQHTPLPGEFGVGSRAPSRLNGTLQSRLQAAGAPLGRSRQAPKEIA